jgi:hypothetical protein
MFALFSSVGNEPKLQNFSFEYISKGNTFLQKMGIKNV